MKTFPLLHFLECREWGCEIRHSSIGCTTLISDTAMDPVTVRQEGLQWVTLVLPTALMGQFLCLHSSSSPDGHQNQSGSSPNSLFQDHSWNQHVQASSDLFLTLRPVCMLLCHVLPVREVIMPFHSILQFFFFPPLFIVIRHHFA